MPSPPCSLEPQQHTTPRATCRGCCSPSSLSPRSPGTRSRAPKHRFGTAGTAAATAATAPAPGRGANTATAPACSCATAAACSTTSPAPSTPPAAPTTNAPASPPAGCGRRPTRGRTPDDAAPPGKPRRLALALLAALVLAILAARHGHEQASPPARPDSIDRGGAAAARRPARAAEPVRTAPAISVAAVVGRRAASARPGPMTRPRRVGTTAATRETTSSPRSSPQ